MPKHKFIATLNDSVFARSTDRVYTHAVVCKDHQPMLYVASKMYCMGARRASPGHFVKVEGEPVEVTMPWALFCGSKDLAEKAAASERKKGWIYVTVVKVVQVK